MRDQGVLVDAVAENSRFINGKFSGDGGTSGVTKKSKEDAWQRVADRVNR